MFILEEGKILFFFGLNGVGKMILLKIIVCFYREYIGEFRVFERLFCEVREFIGYVF